MDFIRPALDIFWSESVWLPPNTTWSDISPDSSDIIDHADYRDLIYPIPLAFILLALRKTLERFWFAPIGISLGIKNSRPKKAQTNPILENAYQKQSRIKHKQHPSVLGRSLSACARRSVWNISIYLGRRTSGRSPKPPYDIVTATDVVALSKQLDWTERQVERWWRLRRGQDKPSTLVKFCENSWRCLYYSFSFIFGITILWDKSYFWDIDNCWIGYPHQSVSKDIWWHYMISLSFYWSLIVSQFSDVRRKDFWQMFVHHIATITLLTLSWICNLHRIGSLVLVVHDCADSFLEAAKITKYANYQKVCDCIFGIFTVVWIITRLGVFPFWIIYSTSIRAPQLVPMFPAYYIFNSLLVLLLCLHVAWTYLILQIAYKALAAGQMEGDLRSSSSEVSDSSGTQTRRASVTH